MKSCEFKLAFAFAIFASVLCAVAAELPSAATRQIDFVKDVQPILSSHCYECHGEKKQKAELRWDVKSVALVVLMVTVEGELTVPVKLAVDENS